MSTFLVERYWPGVTAASARAATARLMTMLAQDDHRRVRCILSMLITDDDTVLTVYEAHALEDVVEANRVAGVPIDRITLCAELLPNSVGSPSDRGAGD